MDPKEVFHENTRKLVADLELRFGRRNVQAMVVYTQFLKKMGVKVPQVQPVILPPDDYVRG
jgi:hypothetical protein